MPKPPTSNPEQIIQGSALLSVPDVPATADYYRNVLGFISDPEGTSDDYTVVWCDNAAVHLSRGTAPPTGVRLFLWVKDVDRYHREVLERGAQVTVEIDTRPYGIRDFSIRDPNGVEIMIGQDWY